jgi:hypothetical protein
MTALANSLKRIWAATSRAPRRTGWGMCGSLAGLLLESALALQAVARQSAPTVLVIILNIFR